MPCPIHKEGYLDSIRRHDNDNDDNDDTPDANDANVLGDEQ